MATTIEDIVVRIKTVGTESLKQANSAVQGLKQDIADLGQAGGPLQNTLNGILTKLGPLGAVAGIAGGAFVALGTRAMNLADEIQDLSDATGIGAGQLLNFRNSLMDAGGEAGSFASAANKLNLAVGEAMSGNEKYQKSFKDLGVVVRDVNGNLRPTGDILEDVVSALAGIQDPAVRAGKAVELLGKEAARINWANVSAGKDAVSDAQIAKLSEYRGEIDKLATTIDTVLIKTFGELAQSIGSAGVEGFFASMVEGVGRLAGTLANIPTDAIAAAWNALMPKQLAIKNPLGLGSPLIAAADEAEAARKKIQEAGRQAQREADAERLRESRRGNRPAGGSTVPGDQGPLSEAKVRAQADSALRAEQSLAESRKQVALRSANQIQTIEINAQYEAQRARKEILARGAQQGLDFSKEAAAKEREIYAKRDTDIANVRRQMMVKSAAEELAMAEENAREMAAYYQQVDQARLQAFDQVESIKLAREELERRIDLEGTLITLSDREAANRRELAELEERRLKAVRDIAAIQDLPYTERVAREKEINAEYDKQRKAILNRQNTEFQATQSFEMGWKKALADYTENSNNSFQQAGKLFQRVTGGMEDAIVGFAKTGKFEFKSFMASVLEDILRSQVQKLLSQLFNVKAGGSAGGGLFGGAIIPGFLATGGLATAGKPYIVGERGPELFVPNATGTVVPNGQLGGMGAGQVIYNINAVDASSFKQLVARDPGFIYAVTEQGRRQLPQTRR